MKRGGITPGRKKGSKNVLTKSRREFLADLFNSEEYRSSLTRRLLSGRAIPMETLGWQYLEGKPTEHLEHSIAPTSGPLLAVILPRDGDDAA